MAHRVILHIDFDSYYTQVEMKRLSIPPETPCAVQQWEGLIAVNYPARAKGITRHMRIREAKKLCPELVLVHVETLGDSSLQGTAANQQQQGGGAAAEDEGGAEGGEQEERHDRLTQKACLERYRRSTAEVLAVLHRHAPAAVIEKASIDEVFMDVTAMVDAELRQQQHASPADHPKGGGTRGSGGGGGGGSSVDAFAWGAVVVGGPLDVSSEFERRLAVGAGIACRLRGVLLRENGYTASAGIAANKLLAKIGSAMHKPNIQTVIPPRSAQLVMQDLPLKKLRNFGGKLGEQLEALGCATAGQVQQLPLATLVAHFGGERAATIQLAVRGESQEPVQERERPKSMLAAKSFEPTRDMAALEGWMRVLAQELAGRMATDEAEYRRRPRNLVLTYRGGPTPRNAPERSRSRAMPRPGGACPNADALVAAAFHLFQTKCAAEALPCSRLAIAASDFVDLPADNGSSIARFLVPAAAAGAGTAGGGSATSPSGGHAAGDQPTAPSAQSPQQQQQLHGKRKGTGAAATAAGGPTVSSMFQRAAKRQQPDGRAALGAELPEQGMHECVTQLQGQDQEAQQQQAHSHQELAQQEVQQQQQEQAQEQAPQQQQHTPGRGLPSARPSPAGSGAAAAPGAGASASGPAAATTASPAAAAEDEQALAGVDLEEQQRIMKEIHMLSTLNRKQPESAGSGQHAARRTTKSRQQPQQRGISSFFGRQPKKGG